MVRSVQGGTYNVMFKNDINFGEPVPAHHALLYIMRVDGHEALRSSLLRG
jgi:hypothetical protein